MTRARHWLAMAAVLIPAALLPAQTASAEILQPNAIVTSTDFGFSPPNVTIALGGTVVFTNQGSVAHEVKTGSAPIFVDLALSAGQTVPLVFSLPGVYHYTAATDCGPGASKPLFSCADYTVNVINARAGSVIPDSSAQAAAPPPAAPTAVPTAPATGVQRDALVAIYDSGVATPSVTITVGGSVTWINYGNSVHTATSTSGQPGFDTGGLGPGSKNTFGFFNAGTYNYTSETDCLNNNRSQGFNCGSYQVVVTTAQPTNSAPATAGSPPQQSMPIVPAATNTTINIDDNTGFQPRTLTVKAGQWVTWVNKGNNVHSVTSDNPNFDSGGIGAGGTFSMTFSTPGTYGYHSVTDASYVNSGACNCVAPFYGVFAGTIVVGS